MNKIKHTFPLPSRRRLIQLYAALLTNAHLKGFLKGEIYTGALKNACVPGLNCYSCPAAAGSCPLGALQNALGASDKKAPYFAVGILLLYAVILGRTICGFLCPFGLVQDLLDKLRLPKLKKNHITRALSWFKYLLLAVFVIFLPLYSVAKDVPLPAFCKYICPAGTLEGAIGLLVHPANAGKLSMLGTLFTWKFSVLVGILLGCMFIPRLFCRFLCPLGALYGLFSRFLFAGVKVDTGRCIDCKQCISVCKMDIRHVGDRECIHCGDCVGTCPTKAIQWRSGRFLLAKNETAGHTKRLLSRRSAVVFIALAVLFFALVCCNLPSHETVPIEANPETDSSIETGYEIGDLCPDFTCPMYASDLSFTLSAHRGKITVINFWATWCAPCVRELALFEQLGQELANEVDIIAIHSNLVTEDVDVWLAGHELDLSFGYDTTGEILQNLGGSSMLPMTIVVDRNGVIVYNAVGSVTSEILHEIIDPLL